MKVYNPNLNEMPNELKNLLNSFREKRNFNPESYLQAKTLALHNYLKKFKLEKVVIAVSGGIDSSLTLAIAHETLKLGQLKEIIAVTLPVTNTKGVVNQKESESLANLVGENFNQKIISIKLDEVFETLKQKVEDNLLKPSVWAEGQLVPYLRTPTLYYLATLHRAIILGTTNKDEGAYLGYFGKASDGLVDVQVISDLHKSEVFSLAKHLKVPEDILNRIPTGDMFDGRSDEELFGCSYDFVELYLEMKSSMFFNEIKNSLTNDSLIYFSQAEANVENLHQYNSHKYLAKSPAIHLDLIHNLVGTDWGNRNLKNYPINYDKLTNFIPRSLPKISNGKNLTETEVKNILNFISTFNWQPANENGYQEIKEKIGSYRMSFIDENWAKNYFERIKDQLEKYVIREGEVYKLIGVSPLLRFIRYESQGSLLPHYDQSYQVSPNQKTLKSLVIYLTTNSDGGTRFIQPNNDSKKDWSRKANPDEVLSVKLPSSGEFLAFDHETLHDSETNSLEKIIIRTDLVYEKLES